MRNFCLATLRVALVAVIGTMQSHAAEMPKSQPFSRENVHEVEARVEAIDVATRKLSLHGPDGVQTITVDPEIRNLDQVHVGDKVRVTYYEGLTVEIKKKGGAATDPVAASAAYRAPVGSKPAGALAYATSATVKIEAIDPKANTVTFKRPDRSSSTTLKVDTPEGQNYIRTLKKGDEVDVVYIEALAIEVVPKK